MKDVLTFINLVMFVFSIIVRIIVKETNTYPKITC